MPPANLPDLPIEVLLQVTARLPSLRDVNSLSRSSRRLSESLNPELYSLDAPSLRSRALFWASLQGSCKVARKALQAGTKVDTYCENSDCKRDWEARERRYGTDSTPLLIAAAYGHVDLVSLFLQQGADQRWTDYDDSTALALACQHGHADVVRLLLSKSAADINFSNRYLETPLILATSSGHLNVVKILLELDNIDVDAITDYGTALFYAGNYGRVEIFDAIHDRGACVSGIVPRKKGIPDLAVVCGLRVPRSLAIAEEMLALGADANAVSGEGRTALMSACEAGNVNVVKMLLSRNVQLFAVDSRGKTALHFACELESPELAELLISRGLDPLTGSSNSRTLPLHCAALTGGCDVVKLLLEKGADPTLLDEWDDTAFASASERRDSDVLSLLLAHCASQNLRTIINYGLLVACKFARAQTAKVLLEAGASPNIRAPGGSYPLTIACLHDFMSSGVEVEVPLPERLELVKALLDAGADVNGAKFGVFGPRPLHCACERDFEQIVELLLSRGANPNLDPGIAVESVGKSGNPNIVKMLISRGLIPKNDSHGRDALFWACDASEKPGAAEVVDILLAYGVDPGIDTRDESDTALRRACFYGNSEIVQSLLSRGVNCNRRSYPKQTTPLGIACERGNLEVVQVLIQHGADLSGLKTEPIYSTKYSIAYYAMNFGILKLLMSLVWDSIGSGPDSTAILEVAWAGDLRAFRELVSRGADPFVSSNKGQTALHIVCYNTDRTRRFIEYLLDLGLDPNAREPRTGFTALHRAAMFISPSLNHVKALGEYGGTDLHIRDSRAKTALNIAEESEQLIFDYIAAKIANQGTA